MLPNLPDYTDIFKVLAVRESRKGRAKGGLIIALNKAIFSSYLLSSDPDFIVIKFLINDFPFLLILIYIPPLADINLFVANLIVNFLNYAVYMLTLQSLLGVIFIALCLILTHTIVT